MTRAGVVRSTDADAGYLFQQVASFHRVASALGGTPGPARSVTMIIKQQLAVSAW